MRRGEQRARGEPAGTAQLAVRVPNPAWVRLGLDGAEFVVEAGLVRDHAAARALHARHGWPLVELSPAGEDEAC
jgi:hypothetical protein